MTQITKSSVKLGHRLGCYSGTTAFRLAPGARARASSLCSHIHDIHFTRIPFVGIWFFKLVGWIPNPTFRGVSELLRLECKKETPFNMPRIWQSRSCCMHCHILLIIPLILLASDPSVPQHIRIANSIEPPPGWPTFWCGREISSMAHYSSPVLLFSILTGTRTYIHSFHVILFVP